MKKHLTDVCCSCWAVVVVVVAGLLLLFLLLLGCCCCCCCCCCCWAVVVVVVAVAAIVAFIDVVRESVYLPSVKFPATVMGPLFGGSGLILTELVMILAWSLGWPG